MYTLKYRHKVKKGGEIILSSNREKAYILSQAKSDNHAIAILEETNLREAAEIRSLIEAEIISKARSNKMEDRQWRIFQTQIKRGRIPTEAYILLRMTEFGYKRIFELAERENTLA